jgi:hypothetical protein
MVERPVWDRKVMSSTLIISTGGVPDWILGQTVNLLGLPIVGSIPTISRYKILISALSLTGRTVDSKSIG